MRIDETNDLLGSVPGLGFAPPSNSQRMTGGKGPAIDTQMQVEDTNSLVESITGGGLAKLNQKGPADHRGHLPLHESLLQERISSEEVLATVAAFLEQLEDFKGTVDAELDDPSDPDDAAAQADHKHDQAVLRDMIGKTRDMLSKAKTLKRW